MLCYIVKLLYILIRIIIVYNKLNYCHQMAMFMKFEENDVTYPCYSARNNSYDKNFYERNQCLMPFVSHLSWEY